VIDGSTSLPGAEASPPAPRLATMAARSGLVGVVVALPAEAQCLVRARLPFGHSVGVNPSMRVCLGGIGMRGALAGCDALLASGVTALVSWGIAGALDPALTAGTMVVAWQSVASGEDVSSAAPAPAVDSLSRAWADRVAARLAGRMPIARAPIAAADELLRTVAAKRALARTGAAAADMETAAVARTAQAAGIPWIAMRAISDTASDALPPAVVQAIDGTGRVRPGRLAAALMRHPTEILQLPALARGYSAALRALRIAAHEAGPMLLAPSVGEDGPLRNGDSGVIS
jgi:adenosylhomocysteine nucleosidase